MDLGGQTRRQGIVLDAMLHARFGLIEQSMAQTETKRTMMSIRRSAWSESPIEGCPRPSTSAPAGSAIQRPSSSSSCTKGYAKNGLRVYASDWSFVKPTMLEVFRSGWSAVVSLILPHPLRAMTRLKDREQLCPPHRDRSFAAAARS